VCCPTAVKIVTGSLQGVLRVHQPHQQGYNIEDILLEAQLDSSILQLAAGNFLGCVLAHADVLLALRVAILASMQLPRADMWAWAEELTTLLCCPACRGTSLCLAVLHPRKLSVYTLQAVGSSYLQLSKLYEHALEHTAANLAYGPFGGVTGGPELAVLL
jgi:Bardet-Biedl syndrome 9 protein